MKKAEEKESKKNTKKGTASATKATTKTVAKKVTKKEVVKETKKATPKETKKTTTKETKKEKIGIIREERIALFVAFMLFIEFGYIKLFDNLLYDAAFNILYGALEILLCIGSFYEIKKMNITKGFTKFLFVLIYIAAISSAFYHIGYAIGTLLALATI